MYYRNKLNNLNTLIEPVKKFKDKLCKLAMKIYYSDINNKIEF